MADNRRRGRIFVHLLRLCIVIVSLLGLTFLATLWGPSRAVLLFTAGRTSTCSLTQSIRSVKETATQIAAFEQISNSSRLIRKDNTGLELWETGQGPFWIISDNDTRWFFLFLAEQETNIYGSGSFGVRPGDIVLDCGAHYGLFARKALAAGAKLVVAIEPAPQNLECLRRNLSKEIAEGRVIVYPKGVWDKEDFLTLHIDQEESGADTFVSERPGGVKVEKVPLTTIDRLVAELELPRVDFIKMDIEGAERHAVTGARATLARHKPRMALAVYHLPDDAEVIPRLVSEAEPSYRHECGFCTDWGSEIRQDIMYFH